MLTDLSPFENLTSIGGYFNVADNTSLTNVFGLGNINPNSINDLSICDNPLLADCDIQSICEYLVSPTGTAEIYNNATGCNNQTEVENNCENNCLPEGITFTTQEQINNFQINYPGCTEIEGDVTIQGDDITNLNGLDVLSSIEGNLLIIENYSLTSLTGLEGVSLIGGDFHLGGNDTLISLMGLEGLISIGGNINVANNDMIMNFEGLSNLNYIGNSVSITYNSNLQNLAGFEDITTINGDLWFEWNGIINLTGLENLISINGNLGFKGEYNLQDLIALQNLTNIGGGLGFGTTETASDAGTSLPSLTGLEEMESIQGGLGIHGNYALTDITALNGLNYLGGDIYISVNDSLSNLEGLGGLTSIGGSLMIMHNDVLTSLAGLNNLDSISGGLDIWSNNALTSLSGLDNIESGTIQDLYINNNISLSTCEVLSICDYLSTPNGTVEIHDNASGCNSQQEVEEACDEVSIAEFNSNETFTISPNPCSGSVNLRYMISDEEYLIFDMIDLNGIIIRTLTIQNTKFGINEMEVDLSDLPAGIYFCTLKTMDEIQVRKLIKL